MEQNIDNKLEFRQKLINFYNSNKMILLVLISVLIIILISSIFIKYKNEKENIIIAEKYVQAGLYLSLDKKDNATVLFDEIILSKNKFYSIMALNTLIEKNLINDNNKILDYFEILESLNYSNEKKDLIIFKKALYFLKISNEIEGEKLLKSLIERNSQFKLLAEEVILE